MSARSALGALLVLAQLSGLGPSPVYAEPRATAAALPQTSDRFAGREAPSTRVLVMPFEADSRDPESAWLGEATAVLLADVLNASGAFAFTREERVSALDYFNLLPSTPLTRATTMRIGRALGASDILVGTVSVNGRELRLGARRLSLARDRFVGDVAVVARREDLSAAVSELATKARLTGPRAATPPTLAAEAFELYVRGLMSQNPSRQITLFELALQAAPRDDRIRHALWEAHTERGNAEAALRVIEAVDRSAGTNRLARFKAGLSLVELSRFDAAFAVFTQLSEERATGAILNNLGVLQLHRSPTTYEGGATYFLTKAAELSPDDPDICFNLGYAYLLEKRPEAAAYWLRESVRRNPTDGDAHAVLAHVLSATAASAESDREWELARLLSERYASSTTRPQSVPSGLERLSRDIEIPRVQSLSMALREPAGREQGEVAAFHLERGRRLVESSQQAEAVVELRKAIYLSPYEAGTHLWLARAYRRLGQVRQAVDALRVSVWCDDGVDARVELAELLFELKDLAGAKREIQRALQLDPASQRARTVQVLVDAR